jgi:hypothetical protein
VKQSADSNQLLKLLNGLPKCSHFPSRTVLISREMW